MTPQHCFLLSCHDLHIVAISEKEDRLTNIKNIIALSKKKKTFTQVHLYL